ncbi:hypothetical protein ACWFNE_00660 [Cellulomonas sp. NPDC055163]
MTAPRGWWARHGATVVLVGAVLTLGVGLGLAAPSTSPVSISVDVRPVPGTAPPSVPGP